MEGKLYLCVFSFFFAFQNLIFKFKSLIGNRFILVRYDVKALSLISKMSVNWKVRKSFHGVSKDILSIGLVNLIRISSGLQPLSCWGSVCGQAGTMSRLWFRPMMCGSYGFFVWEVNVCFGRSNWCVGNKVTSHNCRNQPWRNKTLRREVDFCEQLFAVLLSLSAASQIHVHISIIKFLCLLF